ncbi:hypothetical protein K501DRAFT_252679 [Backusella circina FSU 941]|nr:hypothetical protein K501DRAFT_252679 [Backusella circina FSU 941]
MQLESIQSTVTAEFQFKDEFIWIYFLLIGNAEYIRRTGTFFDQLMGAVQYYKLYASRREIITIAAELDCTQFKDQRSFVCAALLLGRIDDALQYCNNIWMQTHLGHAFLALEVRAESEPSVSSSLDTEVTVDPIYYIADTYAHMIASKYNMWTEAVVYISLCVPNRGVWIERLLSLENAKHIPLLQSVLETVDEYSIDEVKSFIHKSIGQLYEQEHNVHKATIEYGKAQDIQSLDRVGKDLLNKCLETGQLQDNVIGHEELSSSPIYDCVMKYNDLRNYLENKQYKEASRLVLDIFTSNTLPDEFKPMIFIDGDAILSRKESYYKQNELIELLDIFQALLDALSSQTYFEQYYQHALGTKYSADTIIAMLREKMSYRAMIATES